MVSLVTDNDETEGVHTLTHWCQKNYRSLNIKKTNKPIVDFRKQVREHTNVIINWTPVKLVNSFPWCAHH